MPATHSKDEVFRYLQKGNTGVLATLSETTTKERGLTGY
jgi:hypothetical protein